MKKTYSAKAEEIEQNSKGENSKNDALLKHKWYVIDAENNILVALLARLRDALEENINLNLPHTLIQATILLLLMRLRLK